MPAFLPRIWLILALAGALVAGGLPVLEANAATEPGPSGAESLRVQALQDQVEGLRRQLERLKAEYQKATAEYEKAMAEYQKVMEQTKEELQALETRLKTSLSPRGEAQVPGDTPPSSMDLARPAAPSDPGELRGSGRPLGEEELDRITAGETPSPPKRIAQAEAPPPSPQPEKPPVEEAPAPLPPPAPPPAAEGEAPAPSPPPAAQAEEEREVTRVPMATIERGGTLLRAGSFQIETGFGYTHTTGTRLILTGFSVIPLIILGTLESEKATSDSFSPTFTFRYGLLKDVQLDFQVPLSYVHRTTVRLSNDRVQLTEDTATQFGLGDVNGGVTYQFLYERGWLPDLSFALRFRAPTGRSQFDIFEDLAKQGPFLSVDSFITGLNAEGLPTGTGFWGLSGTLSAVKAFDPAVIFGSIGYTYNFPKTVSLIQITGLPAEGGVLLRPQVLSVNLSPGGSFFFSLGIAIALTQQVSVNFGFTDSITYSTKQDGQKIADSSLNSGQFNFGFTIALSRRVSLNFGGSIGVTADAPDLTLGLSVPVAFDSITDLLPFLK